MARGRKSSKKLTSYRFGTAWFPKRRRPQIPLASPARGKTTSSATTSRRALQYYLDTAALQYTQPEAAGSVTYAGLVPIDLDGAIGQVTYRIDESGTTTTASRNSEHDPHVPLYRGQREARSGRAARREDRVAIRDMRRDARRRAGDA